MRIVEKCSNGGNKDLRAGFCQQNQLQYLLKKNIWQRTPHVYSWPRQVLNHILICLRDFMKTVHMGFHIVQGKSRLMQKKIALIIIIVWVWKGEDIPHSIPDHVFTTLIIVGLDGYFWNSFPRNAIKLVRSCLLGAFLLYISLLLESLRAEFTIMDWSLLFIELFIVLISWDNPIIILFGPIEAIHLGIWIWYWPRN